MAKITLVLLLSLVLLLTSCNNKEGTATIQHSDALPKTNYVAVPPSNVYNPPNYSEFYNNFNILHADVQYESRMRRIIKDINPEYFKELKSLTFIYSNKQDAMRTNDGWYFDSKEIVIYFYGESDNYIRYLVLHELKHHWCYINNKNIEMKHQGCFLDTPIDKEYGFIR